MAIRGFDEAVFIGVVSHGADFFPESAVCVYFLVDDQPGNGLLLSGMFEAHLFFIDEEVVFGDDGFDLLKRSEGNFKIGGESQIVGVARVGESILLAKVDERVVEGVAYEIGNHGRSGGTGWQAALIGSEKCQSRCNLFVEIEHFGLKKLLHAGCGDAREKVLQIDVEDVLFAHVRLGVFDNVCGFYSSIRLDNKAVHMFRFYAQVIRLKVFVEQALQPFELPMRFQDLALAAALFGEFKAFVFGIVDEFLQFEISPIRKEAQIERRLHGKQNSRFQLINTQCFQGFGQACLVVAVPLYQHGFVLCAELLYVGLFEHE